MAKIKGPLLSLTASGKIAERLVFSIRASGQQARFQRSQKDIITASRQSQRGAYLEAVTAWKALLDDAKIEWIAEAKSLQYTGYNLFMQNYLGDFINGRKKAYYGIAIFGNSIYGAV